MMRFAVLSSVLTAVLLGGCSREKEAPPPFNYGMSADNGAVLMPLSLKEQDKRLTEPAAAAPEPAAVAEGTAAPVTDTPEAAVLSYLQAWSNGNLNTVVELLIPEQQEQFRTLTETLQPVASAVAGLHQAVQEQFPGYAIQISIDNAALEYLLKHVTIVSVGEPMDQSSEVSLQDATGQLSFTLAARNIDGRWQIDDPAVAAAISTDDAQLQQGLTALAADLEQVATQIRDRQIADVQAAADAVQQTLVAIQGSASAVQTNTEPENAEQPEELSEAGDSDTLQPVTAAPSPRNNGGDNDPVAGVVSSPVLNRGR